MNAWRKISFVVKGFSNFRKSGYLASQKTWDKNDLKVDLKKKSYLVTGANSGLGYVTAKAIAKLGGKVHMICRNPKRGKAAQEKLKKETNNDDIHLHICDVSLMKNIIEFSKNFKKIEKKLDVLVCNAGVLLNKRETTEEKIDKTFGTNTIGTFLLVELLQDLLSKSDDARVVSVSSGGMYTQKLDDDYQFSKMKKWEGAFAYGMTKRHQVVLNEFWAKKYKNIKFYCMHPGWSDTEGVKNSLPQFREQLKNSLRTPEEGADTIIWLAVTNNKKLSKESGLFYFDRAATSTHLTWGGTQETKKQQQDLYDYCCKITNLKQLQNNSPNTVVKDKETKTTTTVDEPEKKVLKKENVIKEESEKKV